MAQTVRRHAEKVGNVEKLLEAVKELLRLLDGNPCTQYSGEGEFKHEHVLFDNIDRDRIVKVRALVEAAEQSVQADGAEAAANGLVYKVEWVDADTIRLTPRR